MLIRFQCLRTDHTPSTHHHTQSSTHHTPSTIQNE